MVSMCGCSLCTQHKSDICFDDAALFSDISRGVVLIVMVLVYVVLTQSYV